MDRAHPVWCGAGYVSGDSTTAALARNTARPAITSRTPIHSGITVTSVTAVLWVARYFHIQTTRAGTEKGAKARPFRSKSLVGDEYMEAKSA